MVKEVVIYIEGDTKQKGKGNAITLRQGFRSFFQAAETNVPIEIKLLGSREMAIKIFLSEVEYNSDNFAVLLVDSEGEIGENETPKSFLQKISDKFDFKNIKEDQCHLMVRLMESWFLADKERLAGFYGRNFNSNALPKNKNVEKIPKDDVLTGLKNATRNTSKGEYGKGAHSGEILQKINPDPVRKSSEHCERMFAAIKKATE